MRKIITWLQVPIHADDERINRGEAILIIGISFLVAILPMLA